MITLSTKPFTFPESFPMLETKRLRLRSLRPTDAGAILEMRGSSLVNRFIGRPEMQSQESAEELVSKTIQAFQERKGIAWAGELKSGNGIIGTCGFNTLESLNRRAEIGGEMHPSFWGKRFAPEAFEAIVQYGFSSLGLHSIEAKVSPENKSAIALLKHLGFEQEALFKDRYFFAGRFYPMAVYVAFA